MSAGTKPNKTTLRAALVENPADWEARKQLAHLLYDEGSFPEASDVIWEAEEIPSIDVELAFAARILAKATPRKAIRLLTALLEHNRGKAVQNLGIANALLHHGMVLQAARFYGAALEADPTLGNPDLEHFILWTDDEETLWGNFQNRRPILGELPWMKRDPREAMKLTSRINTHTTPIKLPSLQEASGESLRNDLYQQKAEKGADITPPPAVTIPIDRVAPKDRLFDEELGALNSPDQAELPLEKGVGEVGNAAPARRELAKPDFGAATSATKPALPATSLPAGGPPRPTVPLPGGPPAVAARPVPTKPLTGGGPLDGHIPPAATLPPLEDFEVEELADPVVVAPPNKPKIGLPPLKK